MEIKRIEISNFRCFKNKTFNFSNQFNLFIGDNNTQKRAFIEALMIGAGSFFLGIDNIKSPTIQKDQIYFGNVIDQKYNLPLILPFLPVVISCHGSFENGEELNWKREIKSTSYATSRKDAREIAKYAKGLQQKVRSQDWDREKIILPLISYYSADRFWDGHGEILDFTKPQSRFVGYENCLTKCYKLETIARWFKTWEYASLQQGKQFKTLLGVKEAINNCVEDCQDVKYDIHQDELIVTLRNGISLPFNMVSNSTKDLIAMVADIAYRCATLNPQFEGEAAQLTPGIVLIDEIDSNLDLKLLSDVIENLKKTFPKIQFFATAHSNRE